MTDIKPGVYPGVPYDVYASWPAVRASTLKECARSLAHGHHSEINPSSPTAAMAFGTALHTAILEPERFRQEYVVSPNCEKRTKEDKAVWAQFEAEYGHLTPLTELQYDATMQIVKSVYDCRDAAELLANATHRELSFVWRDPETEVLCKGRIDMLTTFQGWSMIVDLKSARDASPVAFQRQMTNLGYYRSMAWYRWGLNILAPHDRRCVLLAVETKPPYPTKPYELTRAAIDEEDGVVRVGALDQGEREMRKLLRQYVEATKSGIWTAYGDDIEIMDLPRWARMDEEE